MLEMTYIINCLYDTKALIFLINNVENTNFQTFFIAKSSIIIFLFLYIIVCMLVHGLNHKSASIVQTFYRLPQLTACFD